MDVFGSPIIATNGGYTAGAHAVNADLRGVTAFRPGDRILISCSDSDGAISVSVQVLDAGTQDTIRKPISYRALLNSVAMALERSRESAAAPARRDKIASCFGKLTPRQRQVLDFVLAGHPSKNSIPPL